MNQILYLALRVKEVPWFNFSNNSENAYSSYYYFLIRYFPQSKNMEILK